MLYRRYSVRVYAERIKESHEARLRLRVTWNRSHSRLSVLLGLKVDLARWDPERELCMPKTFHGKSRTPAADINDLITRCRLAVDAAFLETEPTEALLRARIQGVISAAYDRPYIEGYTGASSVCEGFEAFAREKGPRNRWTYVTYGKFDRVRRYIEDYDSRASWEDITDDWLYGFTAWMTKPTEDRKALKDATVQKYLSIFRRVLRWADAKGYLPHRDYIDFRPKLENAERPVIYLDWPELMTVLHCDLSGHESLDRVRDVFCFCCFTGLRWSDVAVLRWSDVTDEYIRVTTQKTHDSIVIELNKYSRAILDKYRGGNSYDLVLPVISNQKMNSALKILMEKCGIIAPVRVVTYTEGRRRDKVVPKWQLIGTHAARRTFICNALMLGVSPNVVMQWTGHSSYAAMKPYIAIADRAKAAAMKVFDEV